MASVLHKAQWVGVVSPIVAKDGMDVLHVHKRRHRLDMICMIQIIHRIWKINFFG